MEPQYIIKNPDDLPTPALVVYRDLVQSNIDRIGEILGGYEKLRTHVKTHKCSAIIKMKQASGIHKFKCATPKEAEMLVANGVRDLVIGYQLLGPSVRRVAELKARTPDLELAVLVDDPGAVDALCKAAVDADVEMGVFVDLNPGMNRTGVPGPEEAKEIARRISDSPGLRFDGIHVYDGHIHDQDDEIRSQRVKASVDWALSAKALIEKDGITVNKLITSGSSTFDMAARHPEVDEVSPGTWILWDRNYAENLRDWFRCAALVVSRVISRPTPRTFTVEAGSKSISTDIVGARHAEALNFPNAKYLIRNEEHVAMELPEGTEPPGVGDLVYFTLRHVCTTVNLWDEMRVVDGEGRYVETWPIDARGH